MSTERLRPVGQRLQASFTFVVLIATSLALQYGLTHLFANRAAVIMLFELIVAAIAAHYLAGEVTRMQDWIGGAMIVSAGLFATFTEARTGRSGH